MDSQKNLFGEDITKEILAARGKKKRAAEVRHAALIRIYGSAKPERCKNCSHLIVKHFSNNFFKCGKSGLGTGNGPGSDWRVNWEACGQFKKLNQTDGPKND